MVARLHEYFERACDRTPDAVALECNGERLTYRDLDNRANRFANVLISRGRGAYERIGIMVPRSVEMYVALLGIGKAGAVFVPIDPTAPTDRVDYIVGDSDLDLLIVATELMAEMADVECDVVTPDEIQSESETYGSSRPLLGPVGDGTCYIIYTSGSTGRPKGVDVTHISICNFIGVVGDIYDVRPTDRVYQGMTIAFDFSIEEIWPTWAAGATLIAGPTGADRIGSGLTNFLAQKHVSVLYCVPTVLATVDRDLPDIRTLLVGGEACPAELVQRWSTPGRRMLNTYGPTEATVTATWCELYPGRPVTIGTALPTYRIAILDEELRPVADGSVGEICIGGPGVARGYIKRPEQTADRFLDDPRITGGGRLYRTGDLGRVLADGEIEYLGRADSEVKIRGHRIDLQEIESILLQDRAVVGAAVAPHPDSPTEDLVAYLDFGRDHRDPDAVIERLHAALRRRLSSYMVPRFVEVLPELPLMASGKVDRKRLPPPSGTQFRGVAGPMVGAGSTTEQAVVAVWSELVGTVPETISVEGNFFDDFGGHSLLAARAVSELRERGIAPGVSVADIYAYPTIRALATELDDRHEGPVAEHAASARISRGRVLACGAAQLGAVAAVMLVLAAPLVLVLGLTDGVLSVNTIWEEAAVIPVTYLLGRFALPIAGVRILARGLASGEYPLWGTTYLRFWTIRMLVSMAPLGTMSGSVLLPWYLRLLGAEVGDDCQLATAAIGVPSLLHMGSRVSVGYGAHVQTFRVTDNRLTLAPVVLGDDTFVGANAVIEPGVELAARAALGEMSLAGCGQYLPEGESWRGSPSRPADPDPLVVEMRSRPRVPIGRGTHAGYLGSWLVVELLPLLLLAPILAVGSWAYLSDGVVGGLSVSVVSGPIFVLTTCLVLAAGKFAVLRNTPTGIHSATSAFAVRKWVVDKLLELSLASTNSLYATLYTPSWLRALGATIGPRSEVSTVANLDPDLLTLGTESFVADMAAVGAATYCNGHLALGHTTVGSRSFIGNAAFLRSGTSVDDECLIGVHTNAPTEHVSTGTSWLGVPAIGLPRRQESEHFTDDLIYRPSRRRVFERFVIEFFRIVVPATLMTLVGFGMLMVTLAIAGAWGALALVLLSPVVLLSGGLSVVLAVVAIKWLVAGRYRPRVEPLWSRFVRRTEFVTALYETAAVPSLLGALTGTPMLAPLLRLFGARIGRRCWIDTTYLTEFDLVCVGDDCSIGTATSLQTHLFEDRVMKMSRLDVREGASTGSRAIVLYDSMVGENVAVDAMSLIMKGEHLPPGTAWQGIPARSMRVEA